MKKIYILFLLTLSFLILLCFSGCEEDLSNYFDKETYDAKLAEWTALGLKNYSFTYTKFGYIPQYDTIGNVTVIDGTGTVIFSIPDGYDDSEGEYIPPSEDKALKNMEAVYENIYNSYLSDVESGEYIYTIYRVNYNDTYPISYSVTSANGDESGEYEGGWSYNILITDFKITEE